MKNRVSDQLIQSLKGRRGHFEMESGYHSEWWFNLDALFAEQERLRPSVVELSRLIAAHRVDVICGPEVGGAKLARMIADETGAAFHFTERFEEPGVTGFLPVRYRVPASQRVLLRGKKVAIVDDAVSAGSAARGTYADLVACGAQPIVLGALFIFGHAADDFAAENGLALETIARMPLKIWPPASCPLCQTTIAIEKISDAGDQRTSGPLQRT